MSESADGDGQQHMLGLLERLCLECKSLWGTSSELYFRVDEMRRELVNHNLHDIPTNLPAQSRAHYSRIQARGSTRRRAGDPA
jgi:hypothetical protein